MSNPNSTPFSIKDPPPCYMGRCTMCGLDSMGPDRMGECIVCYPCLNAEARQRLHKIEAQQQQSTQEIERLRQIIDAKNSLLVAYRLGGDQRRADKALQRLEKLGPHRPEVPR